MSRKRINYLIVSEQFDLNHICNVLTDCGFSTYHVGSSLERSDYRDVDLRCLLDDSEYERIIGGNEIRLSFLNVVISEWLQARTGLPIDFQFQKRTEANKEFNGMRSFIGVPLDILYQKVESKEKETGC